MKKKKDLKSGLNTEGVQIINNNAPIQQQINIKTLNGTISDLALPQTDVSIPTITAIKQAIAQSETDKAFTLLISWLKENHKDKIDDAIIIQGRWEYLKKEKYKGVIDDDVHNREQNRIHQSLLGFMAQLATKN